MGTFFVYMIKVAICLTAFYLLFKLLMTRDTHHTTNRFALLGTVLVSLLLPLVHVDTDRQTVMTATMQGIETLIIESTTTDDSTSSGMTTAQWLFLIYIIGVGAFTVREVLSLISLSRMMRNGRHEATADGLRLIITDREISPFSWFGNIIISRKDYEEHPREILQHEREHARRHHSADILLCDMMIIFQWFNPSAWLLKRELQAVHEYEADDAVLRSGVSASDYQLLLIRKAVGERLYSMANNLNQSSIKKRITMMMTKKSSKWSSLKLLSILPVAAVAVAAFASEKAENISNEITEQSNSLVTEVAQKVETPSAATEARTSSMKSVAPSAAEVALTKDDKDLPKADKTPEFKGGQMELFSFIGQNLHYPKAAEKAGEQGKVSVKFTVEKDGSISNPEVVTGVSKALDEEAIRLIKSMPAWVPATKDNKPVRASVTLPIVFRLKGENTVKVEGNTLKVHMGNKDASVTTSDKSKGEPIYMLDGQPVSEKDFKNISSDKIKEITVLKGDKAIQKYGEKAAGGVIEMTTK